MTTCLYPNMQSCPECNRTDDACPECHLAYSKGEVHRLGQSLSELLVGLGDPETCVDEVANGEDRPGGRKLVKKIGFLVLFANELVKEIGDFLEVDIVQEWKDEFSRTGKVAK